MRLTSIAITNLAGFKEEFKTDLPSVAWIEGKHGAGKSSLQKVLKYALGRRVLATNSRGIEHDPAMLHGTADTGHALITFDEGPLESLRVTVKTDSTERHVKVRGRKAWQAAGSAIDDITNALAYDPMRFRDLAPKERLEAFLQAVPIELTREEIFQAAGMPISTDMPLKPGLDTINKVFDDIYKARTIENVAADTQAKHANELELALPPRADGGDWNAEVTRLRGEKTILEASEAEEVRRIGKEFQAEKDAATRDARSADSLTDEDINAKVAALEAERAKRKKDTSDWESTRIEGSRTRANAEVTEIRGANAPLHARLLTDIATADERARAAAQAEGTRKAAETARAEATARKATAKAMSEALDRLTALKAEVGSRMKIKNCTIAAPRPGQPVDICREEDGALIPFSSWNDFAKDQFCLRMALLFRGSCGLVCIDNMANFSPARRESVLDTCRKYAASEKMQFLIGMANDDGELKVTDVGEKA